MDNCATNVEPSLISRLSVIRKGNNPPYCAIDSSLGSQPITGVKIVKAMNRDQLLFHPSMPSDFPCIGSPIFYRKELSYTLHYILSQLVKLCLGQSTVNRRQMEGMTNINYYLGATQ